MIKFLDLNKQYQSIKVEIDAAIQSVIDTASFIGGEQLALFEKEFSEFLGAGYCVGVGNGTDAIEIAIESLDLPPGSEIIVPANSFIATAEAVTRQGHKVVFADVCPESYVLSIEDVERRITPITKAIIAVHLYGHPCDMDELGRLCQKYELLLIEDCAQAHGAEYKGMKVGSLGDIATFSFYPGKNLGAYGDAGAITMNDGALEKKCRMIANHGRIKKYDHEFEGRNSRLDGLQAAVLRTKLRYLPEWTERRIELADYYQQLLREENLLTTPVRQSWAKQVYHLYVIRTPRRDELKQFLHNEGIETGIHYPIALPKLRAFTHVGQANEPMFANHVDAQLLSLPIGEHLLEEDLGHVVEAIKKFFI